ncbi:helix-turn-helix domain-containing protein [Lactobacillus crispatus]|uniref:Helix-turn-helix domain-containing protein n=2 Tax=Lactobacillus crispatus TaxID=47770 RepID=A0A2I1WH19_9LACO|nr:helix-turn-helix domain-containing protein [Lactobacillus crispatus]MDU7058491.1 helix-turn-helix domain-containing protein [Ligilactobacillus salivarius]KAA8812510.1 helix-turn-helix domain-containing protein [Lactobacillus crispatus]MBD0968789.1 helix-turn-helix domain-containing protein [Lactobacillus crispatus]MBI1707326.1 Transcriptional regulator [Lactobacillus crispatus]MBW0438014.1 helix-turn-helix domain-containing protein [Lactobacillus crispatus]
MTIGEALKKERIMLGLTQTQMAGKVLTKSYYSKIERNVHEINAIDLINILNSHGINTAEFLNNIEKSESSIEIRIHKYNYMLHVAYYQKDLKSLDLLHQLLKKEKQIDEILDLEAQIELLKASIKKDFSLIPINEQKRLKNIILNTENWNESNLRLFSMAMQLFKIEEVNIIVFSIFSKYKNINGLSSSLQKIIAAIAVNFLEYSHCCGMKQSKYTKRALDILDSLTEEPNNCFAKLMKSYYQNVFDSNAKEAKKILDFLSKNGMSEIVSKIKYK